jgi:hypothetical protein
MWWIVAVGTIGWVVGWCSCSVLSIVQREYINDLALPKVGDHVKIRGHSPLATVTEVTHDGFDWDDGQGGGGWEPYETHTWRIVQ